MLLCFWIVLMVSPRGTEWVHAPFATSSLGYKSSPCAQSWQFNFQKQKEDIRKQIRSGILKSFFFSLPQTYERDFLKLSSHSSLSRVCLDLPACFVERWCSPLSTRSATLPPAAALLPRPWTTWDLTPHRRDLTPAWDLLSLRYVQSNNNWSFSAGQLRIVQCIFCSLLANKNLTM